MFSSLVRRITGLFVLLAALVFGAGPVQAQTAAVEGRVLDEETGEPLAGVNVRLQALGRGTTTDLEGRFRLGNIAPGSHELEVTFLGYGSVTRELNLQAGQTARLQIELSRRAVELDPVVVSATRAQEPLATIPASVTAIGLQELEVQQAITGDLGAVIAQTAPGLAPSTGTLSNYGQTLRGRNLSVLVDGVPQSTPLRNVLRDLRTIDLSAIERVEVVRGASAAYGYGATGGMINIITRRPTTEGPRFTTRVGSRFAPAQFQESAGGQFLQQVTGRAGRVGYAVTASYQNRGVQVDGEGDIVPPDPHAQGGLALSDEYNVLGKADVRVADGQQLTVSANYYDLKQNLSYVTADGIPGEQKTTAVPADSVPGEDPGTENLVLNVEYTHENVAGSRLSARAYVQDYMSRFGYADYFPEGGGQSYLTSTKVGTRLDAQTPLSVLPGSQIHWGLDALTDQTAQPLLDGRSYVPPIRQTSLAPFTQLKLSLGRRLLLRAGGRYERIGLSVDDFTTLFGDNSVEGGSLTYDAFVFNAGGVVFLNETSELFGSFSQGFSVSDIGRALRTTTAASVEQFNPEAQKVDSYELGLRGSRSFVGLSITGFLNTSELGSTFGDLPELAIIRSPERIYGLETSADLRPTDRWRLGGTFTWMEGKRDSDNDGSYDTYLPGARIPPSKTTAYVGYSTIDGWNGRLQILHSGDRDRFPGSGAFGEGPVDSFVRVDLQGRAPLGPGALELGIENLFDTLYFPPISQWYNYGYGYSAAPGRTVTVSYSVTW